MGDLWVAIKKMAGKCASNMDIKDLKSAADKGKKSIEVAEISSEFLTKFQKPAQKLGKAKEALGKISSTLGSVEDICLDIQAVGKIHEGIKVLQNEHVIRDDPEKAAKAFGNLFGGFGQLAKHLPFPADLYADILIGAGGDFFNEVRNLLTKDDDMKNLGKQDADLRKLSIFR